MRIEGAPDGEEHLSQDDDESMGSDLSLTKPELPKTTRAWIEKNAKKPTKSQKSRNKRKEISPGHAGIEISNPFDLDLSKRVRN